MENHHAFLVSSESIEDSSIPEAYKIQSVDTLHFVIDVFGIDESRELIHHASQKPVQEENRTFVISCSNITREAQNALLKLFEEPPTQSQFFLVIQNTHIIIPTLRSRLVAYEIKEDRATNDAFASFVALSYKERLLLIAEKTKAKEQIWIQQIIHGAERHVSRTTDRSLLASTLLVGEYISRSGSSKKMLLEELALSL